MVFPNHLKYSEGHVWLNVEGGTARLGITDYAQEQLGDILFVDLPETDSEFEQGEVFTEVESSKTAVEIRCPVSGRVTAVNEELDDSPENINDDPYGNWIVELELSDETQLEELLSASDYEAGLPVD